MHFAGGISMDFGPSIEPRWGLRDLALQLGNFTRFTQGRTSSGNPSVWALHYSRGCPLPVMTCFTRLSHRHVSVPLHGSSPTATRRTNPRFSPRRFGCLNWLLAMHPAEESSPWTLMHSVGLFNENRKIILFPTLLTNQLHQQLSSVNIASLYYVTRIDTQWLYIQSQLLCIQRDDVVHFLKTLCSLSAFVTLTAFTAVG